MTMLTGFGRPAPTPVSELLTSYKARHHTIVLKHECHHPSGSVKERTALGLLHALHSEQPLTPGTTVVESTSGNLGLALAQHLAEIGCRFIAVVDPKTPATTCHTLRAAGASLRLVDEEDGHGGYLHNRLETVRGMLRTNPELRWTDQYSNPANPLVHAQTTGPEILAQGGPDLGAVYVAVSTGGTLAGIARHVRANTTGITITAVDARSSIASDADDLQESDPMAATRLLPGIGASRRSSFLHADTYDTRHQISDWDAIALCRILREDTDIGIGGSAGSVLSACIADLGGAEPPSKSLCLAPDDADRYEDTVYDDDWLAVTGLLEPVNAAMARLRNEGLSFKADALVRFP